MQPRFNYLFSISAFIGVILTTHLAFAQGPDKDYQVLVTKADSLYQNKLYKEAADTYTKAFEGNDWKGYIPDLYSAAKAWAMLGNLDSAFRKLDRVITYSRHREFKNYENFEEEPAFQVLNHDERWKNIIEKANEKYNNPLVLQLDTIFSEDQKYRILADSVFKHYGYDSPEGKALIDKMLEVDSINLAKVKKILDQYGWLSVDEVGDTGNMAIFLVIQHADSATQVEYLPMMREAVRNNKANASQLALLEDRVALKQGKKQIYGSQIGLNKERNEYYVLPLEDPENVDKRRKEVGLPPLGEYTQQWGFEWNIEEDRARNNNE